MEQRFKKVGGSVGLSIPAIILKDLKITAKQYKYYSFDFKYNQNTKTIMLSDFKYNKNAIDESDLNAWS